MRFAFLSLHQNRRRVTELQCITIVKQIILSCKKITKLKKKLSNWHKNDVAKSQWWGAKVQLPSDSTWQHCPQDTLCIITLRGEVSFSESNTAYIKKLLSTVCCSKWETCSLFCLRPVLGFTWFEFKMSFKIIITIKWRDPGFCECKVCI